MQPSEVRHRILNDHRLIKIMVAEVRDLALRIQAGEPCLSGRLRERGRNLYERLRRHIDFEGGILICALVEASLCSE